MFEQWEAWYNKGYALSTLGRKQEAIAAYEQAININKIPWVEVKSF